MSGLAATNGLSFPLYRVERVISSLTVAGVVALTTFMIFQNETISPTGIYFLKIVLALSGSVMLATLPGFFDLNYRFGGLSVRAAGGSAAFIFIYTQSPALPAFHDGGAVVAPHAARQIRSTPTARRVDGFPALMALTIAPAGFMPSEASHLRETSLGGSAKGAGKSSAAWRKAPQWLKAPHRPKPTNDSARWWRQADKTIRRLNRLADAVLIKLGKSVDRTALSAQQTANNLRRDLRIAARGLRQRLDTLPAKTYQRLDELTGGMAEALGSPMKEPAASLSKAAGKIASGVLPGTITAGEAILGQTAAGFDLMAAKLDEILPALSSNAEVGLDAAVSESERQMNEQFGQPLTQHPGTREERGVDGPSGDHASQDDYLLGQDGRNEAQSGCISGCNGEMTGPAPGLAEGAAGESGITAARGGTGPSRRGGRGRKGG